MPEQDNPRKTIELMIVDAPAMVYRAYYAFQGQNLTNPVTGQPTAAIFGYFRMLFKVLFEYEPKLVAVVWDAPGKNFRHDLYTDYKATRKPMPDDLRPQFDEIKELSKQCGISGLELPGYEADDIIGSLVKKFESKGNVVILSGDKDCYQLLSNSVTMLRSSKGVSEFIEIDPEWVKKELGVSCDQIVDYMALVGDSSDNVPGAQGIGPKGAANLLAEYGTLAEILKNREELKPAGVQKKVNTSYDEILLSQKLVTIDTQIKEIKKVKESELVVPDLLADQTLQLFRQGGYQQLYDQLLKARGSDSATGGSGKLSQSKTKYKLISTLSELEALVKKLEKSKLLSVDTETDSEKPIQARLVGISLAAKPGEAYYIALPPNDSLFASSDLNLESARPSLQRLFENETIKKVGQNIKYDLIVLRRHGWELKNIVFDTMIASYLCSPNLRRHSLDDMALDILSHDTIHYEQVVGSGRNKVTMAEVEPEKIRDYACEDADLTLQLKTHLEKKVKDSKLEKVFNEIELPLIAVLAGMEEEGVAIDGKHFSRLSKDYEKLIKKFEKSIFEYAGHEFNVNSTKELQKVLFDELKLPPGKKTKTGYSTDQSVLEGLRGHHPVVDNLLDHRRYSKLKSTYVDALPELVNPSTGRIHTSFNQTIAATGRLSSNEPNLQNIPIREESGRDIRRGFIAREGCELLSLDYSQIELRIMAHYSQDDGLLESFVNDEIDIHNRTACSLFGVEPEGVTPEMRSHAKVVNFSIIYGVTEFGLARSLGVSRSEAASYIEKFFESYPGVRRFMNETIELAEKEGAVRTLTGRLRQIPDITSSNRFRREGAQRTAVNTPIQGTSADIIKIAMIRIHEILNQKKLRSRMILQVHDELLFDVYPDERDQVLEIARSEMEGAMKLSVPLTVDYKFGANWNDAH